MNMIPAGIPTMRDKYLESCIDPFMYAGNERAGKQGIMLVSLQSLILSAEGLLIPCIRQKRYIRRSTI